MRFVRYAMLLLSLALVVWGALLLREGLDSRELRAARVADLEAGTPPPGGWLKLTGKLRSDERVIWDGVRPIETYVALVSENWKPGQPVVVFIRTNNAVLDRPGKLLTHTEPDVIGVVRSRSLPDWVKDSFIYNELQPADRPLVLEFEARPGDELFFGGLSLIAGLGLCGTVLIMGRRKSAAGAKSISEEKQP
ncbi:MAG: hypothetical protein JNM56_05985 [Planctomycetia bacterium]|nr:hypothetical protein [Planctomycetia bacterium]